MDVELGTNTGCVILSLMGVDDRPRKKLIQGHKRVLSDEYHQRVASMASHVRHSSFKCYSFETRQNHETNEASAGIGRNKRCKMSIDEEEEMSDVMTGLVDELISGMHSSHSTARHYPQFDNFLEPLTNSRVGFACKRSLGSSYADSRYGNCSVDLFSTGGCLPKSRSSAASSVGYGRRESVQGRVNVASEPTAESEIAVGKVRVEQETSPYDSEGSFYTNRSSIETDSFKSSEDKYLRSPDSVLESFDEEMPSGIITKLSEQGTQLHSFGFDPSMAWLGEIGTTASSDGDREDQDNSRPARISENREFNYLMEILTEAGFSRKNLASGLDKWHSLESPLSPFVFEKVEKRYADDKSWETSDRELLFDRMNSWLEGILKRSMSVPSRHVPARISDQFRCDINEKALWRSLVKEGKELKGETTEDLLKRDLGSLDLAEFIVSIVAEIERSVIDVLISELVSE